MYKLLAYSVACLLLHLALPCAHAAPPAPGKIPVIAEVHTWGELLSQKPITLPNNGDPTATATYRFGIDHTHAQLYGGAVLYCAAEGNVGEFVHDGSLLQFPCPFVVELNLPQKSLPAVKYAITFAVPDAKAVPLHLFMEIIPLNYTGKYTIALRKPSQNGADIKNQPAIATTSVTVAQNSHPLWSPWSQAKAEPSGSLGDPYPIATPKGGVAIPAWTKDVLCSIQKRPGAKVPLPQLFPAQPDPGIHLALSGNLLTVHFKNQIPMDCLADLWFLTRWWVNGEPFTPNPGTPEITPRAEGCLITMENEIPFAVELDPKRLHAKKGDTIGVQLLYCPSGWQYTGPQAMSYMTEALADTDAAILPQISRLTNRITFTYTGDPAAMSGK